MTHNIIGLIDLTEIYKQSEAINYNKIDDQNKARQLKIWLKIYEQSKTLNSDKIEKLSNARCPLILLVQYAFWLK